MPQALHCKYGHIVFSTKNRAKLITPAIESRLLEYMGGIVRGLSGVTIEINGTRDHVHLLIRESKSIADQDFIGQLKGDSSRWVNQTLDLPCHFAWQAGYGWFSVAPRGLSQAREYVRNQKTHHESIGFKEEFRQFLDSYDVAYDEEFVWD